MAVRHVVVRPTAGLAVVAVTAPVLSPLVVDVGRAEGCDELHAAAVSIMAATNADRFTSFRRCLDLGSSTNPILHAPRRIGTTPMAGAHDVTPVRSLLKRAHLPEILVARQALRWRLLVTHVNGRAAQ